ncbi:MAG: hypothetical protein Q7J54_05620 [Candidatus Woesearchaeota archaeon]|nr:hypothetical protein [Candidatus Woesearchaeota archaeon]
MNKKSSKQTERKYSRGDLILAGGIGGIGGLVMGYIEGTIGNLAIPTSLRCINDKLDENLDSILRDDIDRDDRIMNLFYHATRLPIRLYAHATLLYKAFANIAEVINKQDINELDSAVLLIPSIISLGYEIYRAKTGKTFKEALYAFWVWGHTSHERYKN